MNYCSKTFTVSKKRDPICAPHTEKYTERGLFSENNFNDMPSEIKMLLTKTANHSLAKSTWSSYRTSLKRLKDCETETGKNMDLPLNERQVLLFIGYLLKENLTAATIETYMAGLRQAHIAEGWGETQLKSHTVKQIIRGRRNELLNRETSKRRLPITPTILQMIKIYIKNQEWNSEKKLLTWAITTIAFHGGFRVHELLPQNLKSFDPEKTLLRGDIILKNIKVNNDQMKILQICLKTEKTRRTKGHTLIDIYESKGKLCPIRAYEKWSTLRGETPNNLPAFRDEEGANFTGRRFNGFLRSFTETNLPNIEGSITSHSFRSGLATMLGTLGFSDEEIKATGRWSSKAFNAYLKLPRTQRAHMAREIARLDI